MRIGNEKIDLGLTLIDSAQCFRWTRAGDAFGAVLNRAPVWLVQEECGEIAEGGERGFLRDYLDLNRDYAAAAREYEAASGGGMVTARVNGKHELLSLAIKPEAVDPDDVEMLSDMVVAAVNAAMKSAEEDSEKTMGKLTGGINMPGLF